MASRTKEPVLLVLVILTIIGFIFAFNSNTKADKNRKLFEKEMAFRLDMEEKVSKLRNENMDLATALKNKDLDIRQKVELIGDLNQTVSDQNTEIESLKSELRKVTLLKEQLESDLKEALSSKQK
ncbi:hypothetical protein ACFL2Y_03250 [Candidatus Omnitrophota bacterium]